jgi:hypothetical protein
VTVGDRIGTDPQLLQQPERYFLVDGVVLGDQDADAAPRQGAWTARRFGAFQMRAPGEARALVRDAGRLN